MSLKACYILIGLAKTRDRLLPYMYWTAHFRSAYSLGFGSSFMSRLCFVNQSELYIHVKPAFDLGFFPGAFQLHVVTFYGSSA